MRGLDRRGTAVRMNRLFTVSQAANFLGVSVASVRKWSDAGLLPAYRTPGGQRRYSLDDLEEFLWSMREPVIRRGRRPETTPV
jgi:excisionase family DNA binding protein